MPLDRSYSGKGRPAEPSGAEEVRPLAEQRASGSISVRQAADRNRILDELLQACARGDPNALKSVYTLTAAQLFALARGILRNRELAEDALQDSFVRVWRHAHTYDPARCPAMAWLARIVRNRCFDLLRQGGRDAPLDAALMASWEDPAPDPAELAALSGDARRLRDCIDELDESPRQSVLLAYYYGLTFEEVAGRLGTPLGTVKSWIRRSLVRLKGCMERWTTPIRSCENASRRSTPSARCAARPARVSND